LNFILIVILSLRLSLGVFFVFGLVNPKALEQALCFILINFFKFLELPMLKKKFWCGSLDSEKKSTSLFEEEFGFNVNANCFNISSAKDQVQNGGAAVSV
jgi:hypothetical protein